MNPRVVPAVELPDAFREALGAVEARLEALPTELLPMACAAVAGAVEAARTRAVLGLVRPPDAAPAPPAPQDVLDTRGLAAFLGRSTDWLYEHRGEFVSANVSGKGQRARYDRRLVQEILEKNRSARARR